MNRILWYITGAIIIALALLLIESTLSSEGDVIISDCVSLCQHAKEANINLSQGPCLSDGNPEWRHVDWVCDVAHNPRKSVDNLPENQCKEFREGKAHHFVEVTPECEFIRAV
jgi:hypothetical protein